MLKKYHRRNLRRKLDRKNMTVILVLLVCFSLVFAYIITSLSVNATLHFQSASWDVHFENVQVDEDSITPVNAPNIVEETNVNFSVMFDDPDDYYSFSVDAVNDGNVDAMIEDFSVSGLTTSMQEYIDFTVKYEDGNDIRNYDLLEKNSSKTIVITMKYKDNITAEDLPDETETTTLTISTDFVQADDSVYVESASSMKQYIDSTIYTALPSELQEVISTTKTVSGHETSDSNNFALTDKLYLLATCEV